MTINLPAGAALTGGWSATFTGSTGSVEATNLSYNGNVTSGQSRSFGFQGTGTLAGATLSCTAL